MCCKLFTVCFYIIRLKKSVLMIFEAEEKVSHELWSMWNTTVKFNSSAVIPLKYCNTSIYVRSEIVYTSRRRCLYILRDESAPTTYYFFTIHELVLHYYWHFSEQAMYRHPTHSSKCNFSTFYIPITPHATVKNNTSIITCSTCILLEQMSGTNPAFDVYIFVCICFHFVRFLSSYNVTMYWRYRYNVLPYVCDWVLCIITINKLLRIKNSLHGCVGFN